MEPTKKARQVKRLAEQLVNLAEKADALDLKLPNGGIVGSLIGGIADDLQTMAEDGAYRPMTTYKIVRGYRDRDERDIVETGLTLEEAKAHCRNPETTSSKCTSPEGIARTEQFGPWFDGFEEE